MIAQESGCFDLRRRGSRCENCVVVQENCYFYLRDALKLDDAVLGRIAFQGSILSLSAANVRVTAEWLREVPTSRANEMGRVASRSA